MRWNKSMRWIHGAAAIFMILSLGGCERDEPKVYRIPKDTESPPQQAAPAAAPTSAPETPPPAAAPQTDTPQLQTPQMPQQAQPPDMGAAPSVPALKYQLPAGWQEKPPTEMRVASFTALGPNGQSADVSVIPLPVVGRDLELVNMWRSQVQLPPTSDPAAVKQAVAVTIGTEQGRLFAFTSDQPMIGKARQGMLVAMLTRGTMSWFIKIAGDDAFVTSQKQKFLQFLKSISFDDQGGGPTTAIPATMDTPTVPAPSADGDSVWTIPPGWQAMPPSQFLLAEFSVAGAGGAKAEINVAEMGGEGGGLLANVNRWRGQLGLGAVSDNDLAQQAKPLDVPDGKATQVDFTGTDPKTNAPTRLVAVVVAQSGQTWFYKLMGDQKVVAQQKDAFTKFIQSANYANAR